MIHISKRGDISRGKAVFIKAAAILVSLVVCAVIITVTTGENPLSVFETMIAGAFGTKRKTWIFLQNTAILLMISIAVTPAYRMRCWNLGAEGQVLAGALSAAACILFLPQTMAPAAVIAVTLIASVAAGALWAAVPAFFKSRWNTNETLFTLMMNYVATQLVAYYVKIWENPKGSNTVGVINQKTQFGWLPQVYNKQLLVVIVAVVLTAAAYVYLRYSKHGYEISVVGERTHCPLHRHKRPPCHNAHDGAFRRGQRSGGLPVGLRHKPHHLRLHRGRAGLYRRHDLVDVQIQPARHGTLKRTSDVHGRGRGRYRHLLRAEPVLRRHAHRHHHLLHHRQ